ncbi:MAG: Gfo/Idh/MocA family oxidoreductase [Deltaproteobacteria bacterium]|nr:Gfo/Idh/MocA family oxidoreductase [Deltaproteobacteria bacterium]
MQNPRVAVVGVGHLGQHHARIFHELGVLSAVADSDAGRAAEVASRYRVPHSTDYRTLLDGVDGVSIAVPTQYHFEVAKDFLERGIPALVEKPLTRTIEEGEELVRIARARGAHLQVGHVERFNPAVEAILGHVRKPRFIEVHRLSPFRFRSSDIDVVMDLMIHDLDLVLHLAQSPLVRVDAVGTAFLFGKEDIANARLEFESGCVANLTASRISTMAKRKTRVFSDDCYVTIDTLKREAWVYRTSPQLVAALAQISKEREPTLEDLALIPEDFYSIQEIRFAAEEEPLRKELESFLSCLRTGTEPVVCGEHGVLAIRAAQLVLREIRSHRWS